MGVPVVLPPSTNSTLIEGLAARLGITLADPTDLARAQAAVDDASAEVQGFLRGPLGTATDTVTLDSPCGRELWLPFRRVQSVTDVLIGLTPVAVGDWQVRGDTLWRYWGWQQYAYSLQVPPTVTVTVTHGFTVLPAEIVAIIYALAMTSWQNPEGLRQFQRQVTQGAKSEMDSGSYATETVGNGTLSAGQMATLERFRTRRRTSVPLASAC